MLAPLFIYTLKHAGPYCLNRLLKHAGSIIDTYLETCWLHYSYIPLKQAGSIIVTYLETRWPSLSIHTFETHSTSLLAGNVADLLIHMKLLKNMLDLLLEA